MSYYKYNVLYYNNVIMKHVYFFSLYGTKLGAKVFKRM